MSLRKNLEYLRKSKNLSQEDLAFKLGVSRQAVSKWESGAAYPETEKMIAMCKLFDCSLDELLNEDIAEARDEEIKRYTFNDLVKEIKDVIKRTSDMFNSMSGKLLFRFFFEIAILFIFILLLRIPFDYVYSLGYHVFLAISGSVGDILGALWKFFIEIIYFITSIVSFLYIYKIRFLDRFESVVDKKEQDSSEEIVEMKKREVVKYDFGIFSFIEKAFVFCVKLFVVFTSIFICIAVLFDVAGLVVVLSWIFKGIFFISLILFAISFLLLAALLIYVAYNFVVNRRSKWEKVFIFLLVSLFGFGLSMGVGVLEMKNFTFTNSQPGYIVQDKKIEEIKMSDSLVLNNIWYPIKYVEDNSMSDTVRIQVSYYGDYESINIGGVGTDSVYIQSSRDNISFPSMYELFLRDLKDKTIHNYGKLFEYDVVVYTSKENIEKIQKNIQTARESYNGNY